jgi:hypothetical protein
MNTFLKHKWREILIALGALIFGLLVSAADLLNLGEQTGADHITQANDAYLTDAANEGLKETLLLGEVAALLEVLGSTDIGIELIVSVDVQAGGVLSNLTRAIEWALAASTSATIGAHALKFVNAIADQGSANIVITLAWAVIAWMILRIVPAARTVRRMARSIAEILAVLFVISYLIIPYSINLTGWLGQTVSGSLAPDTETVVETFHGATFTDGGLQTDLGYWTRGKNVKSAYESVTSELPDKVSALMSYTVQKFAHLVIVGVLFPLSVLLLLAVLGRRLVGVMIKELDAQLDLTKPKSGD